MLIFVFSLFKKFSLTVLWWFLFLRKQSKNQIKGLKLRIFKSLKRHNRLALTGWGLAPTRIITKPNMNNCILVQLLQNCAKFNCPEQDIENYWELWKLVDCNLCSLWYWYLGSAILIFEGRGIFAIRFVVIPLQFHK